jgi:hypothetical protein
MSTSRFSRDACVDACLSACLACRSLSTFQAYWLYRMVQTLTPNLLHDAGSVGRGKRARSRAKEDICIWQTGSNRSSTNSVTRC